MTQHSTLMPAAASSRELQLEATRQQPQLQRFESVREQVETAAQGQWDVVVQRRDIAIKDGQVTFAFDKLGEHQESLSPTTWATAQLCTRLGIPVSYYRKCPTVLQDMQANFWLKNGKATHHGPVTTNGQATTHDDRSRNGNASHNGFGSAGSGQDDAHHGDCDEDGFGFGDRNEDETCSESNQSSRTDNRERVNEPERPEEQWLLRARHGDLRAVLSERYSPLDNDELMATLAPLLASRYRVDWFALGEESLHLRIIDPTRLREVLPDDPLSVGIHIANSEVGKRSVSVDSLVYRLVCSNGLIKLVKNKSLLKRRHVHLSRPRFRASLEEALHNALQTAESFLDQLERTVQQPVPDVEGTLEKLGERWHLSQHTQDAVKAAIGREPTRLQDTLYGLVNGFTQVAQGLANDDRYDMEVLAGRLAENGLPTFARSKREKSLAVKSDFAPSTEEENEDLADEHLTPNQAESDVEMSQHPITEPSIIDLAREMFDAEIVDDTRVPLEVA